MHEARSRRRCCGRDSRRSRLSERQRRSNQPIRRRALRGGRGFAPPEPHLAECSYRVKLCTRALAFCAGKQTFQTFQTFSTDPTNDSIRTGSVEGASPCPGAAGPGGARRSQEGPGGARKGGVRACVRAPRLLWTETMAASSGFCHEYRRNRRPQRWWNQIFSCLQDQLLMFLLLLVAHVHM